MENQRLHSELANFEDLNVINNKYLLSGFSSLYNPSNQFIYLRTDVGAHQICLNFFHELKHFKEYNWSGIGWNCIFDSNTTHVPINGCETLAEQFSKDNSWRCEKI